MRRETRTVLTEEEAIAHQVRELMKEQGYLNLTCMESLFSTSIRAQSLKLHKCAMLAQDVNLEEIDLMIEDERLRGEKDREKAKESEDPIIWSFNLSSPPNTRDRRRSEKPRHQEYQQFPRTARSRFKGF